jgi:hypothetical protein
VHARHALHVLDLLADHGADLQGSVAGIVRTSEDVRRELRDLGRRIGAAGLGELLDGFRSGGRGIRQFIPTQAMFRMLALPHLDQARCRQREFLVGGENLERGNPRAPVVDVRVLTRNREDVEARKQDELAVRRSRKHTRLVVGGSDIALVVEPRHVLYAQSVHEFSRTQLGAALVGK